MKSSSASSSSSSSLHLPLPNRFLGQEPLDSELLNAGERGPGLTSDHDPLLPVPLKLDQKPVLSRSHLRLQLRRRLLLGLHFLLLLRRAAASTDSAAGAAKATGITDGTTLPRCRGAPGHTHPATQQPQAVVLAASRERCRLCPTAVVLLVHLSLLLLLTPRHHFLPRASAVVTGRSEGGRDALRLVSPPRAQAPLTSAAGIGHAAASIACSHQQRESCPLGPTHWPPSMKRG